VILFFLAFLPQFVHPASGATWSQMLIFGLTFTLQAAVIFAIIGALVGSVGQKLASDPRIGKWLDRVSGAIFIGLGVFCWTR
jgi:threonine/homoserine/homoserine lactone efflux protein